MTNEGNPIGPSRDEAPAEKSFEGKTKDEADELTRGTVSRASCQSIAQFQASLLCLVPHRFTRNSFPSIPAEKKGRRNL